MAIVMVRPKLIWVRLGDSRSGGYEKIKKGLLPPLVSIGGRSKSLPDYEIDAINSARISEKSDDEIKALVRKLVADRKKLNVHAGDKE